VKVSVAIQFASLVLEKNDCVYHSFSMVFAVCALKLGFPQRCQGSTRAPPSCSTVFGLGASARARAFRDLGRSLTTERL
jgi:hypothetical protein